MFQAFSSKVRNKVRPLVFSKPVEFWKGLNIAIINSNVSSLLVNFYV